MNKITFNNGSSIEFEPFELKESNLRKINVLDSDGDSEGPWVYLSDKDIDDYDNNKQVNSVYALANHIIAVCSPTWGMYIPVTSSADNTARPVCDLRKWDISNIENRYFAKEALEGMKEKGLNIAEYTNVTQ